MGKASAIVGSIGASSIVGLRYRTTFARVLDANRKFLDAALRYYELSTTEARIAAEDVLELLSKAVVCAVLGKVSAQRSRVLEVLHKVSDMSGGKCVFRALMCALEFRTREQ